MSRRTGTPPCKLFGSPLKLSGSPVRVDGAAPMLGQHNRDVFVEWLGMPVDRFKSLRAAGVI